MRLSRVIGVALVLPLVGVVGACGDGDTTVVRPPVSSAPAEAPTTTATAPTTTATAPTTATSPPGAPQVSVTPASGLISGQRVAVAGSGFSPNEALVVTECAARANATGPGDCNLNGMVMTTSDASGDVQVELVVVKGPFGANGIICGAAQPCLVSVTQATPLPTQEADTRISFQ